MARPQEMTIIRSVATPRKVARIELENGVSFTINEASLPMKIGRDHTCDICIPSGHVSRQHCELYLVNGVLCLKDTSSNGTDVGRRLVKQSSVSIQGMTVITLAGEARLTVTPDLVASGPTPACNNSERRNVERRDRDRERREQSVVVIINRRSDRTRRGYRRRESARH